MYTAQNKSKQLSKSNKELETKPKESYNYTDINVPKEEVHKEKKYIDSIIFNHNTNKWEILKK